MPLNAAAIKAIKKLPWPKALREGKPLSLPEVYRTGQIINEKVRSGKGTLADIPLEKVASIIGSSTSTLYRAAMAYDVANKYGLKNRLNEVSATLLYNLERLPEKQRSRFAEQALKEGWSKREITRRATGGAAPPKTFGAIRATKPLATAVDQLQITPPAKDNLSTEQLKEARRNLRLLQASLKKWEKALK